MSCCTLHRVRPQRRQHLFVCSKRNAGHRSHVSPAERNKFTTSDSGAFTLCCLRHVPIVHVLILMPQSFRVRIANFYWCLKAQRPRRRVRKPRPGPDSMHNSFHRSSSTSEAFLPNFLAALLVIPRATSISSSELDSLPRDNQERE